VIMIHNKRYLLVVALLSVFAILSVQGCNCEPAEHPKLSSMLNKLVQAEWRGEAEEFARPRGIELLYDDTGLVSVEVIIECLPGRVEEAAGAAETYGTVGVISRNMIVVVVPITSLSALADEESIGSIRLPDPPEGA
jgi:hypothetical protein